MRYEKLENVCPRDPGHPGNKNLVFKVFDQINIVTSEAYDMLVIYIIIDTE